MKIRSVKLNNHSRAFEVRTATRRFSLPYAKVDPRPTGADPIGRVYVDPEMGWEAFTYVLASGREGTVPIEQVLDYNRDPRFMRDLLLYKLTVEACERVDAGTLSKREIIRRLGTSASQLSRLLDTTNYRKSVDQLLRLLRILDCEVSFVVKEQPPRYWTRISRSAGRRSTTARGRDT